MEQQNNHLTRFGYGFIALLLAFASISTDLYLPAMPTMAELWGADDGVLEFSVTGYLAGFAIGQLFWGPISDHRGRKITLAVGLVLFIVGSLGCGLSDGVVSLISWRVVQAIGASAAVVIGRAIVADLYQGKAAAQVFATLTAIMVVAPMIGPLLGARILAISSWPYIFFTLVAVGTITLLMLPRAVPESLPPQLRTISSNLFDRESYGALLANKRMIAYSLISMVFTAGIFAYVAGSSFVFIDVGGLSPDQFGMVFGAAAAAIIVANLFNARLVSRFGTDTLLLAGIINATLMTGLLVLGAVMNVHIGIIVVLVVLYAGSNGFIQANSISAALNSVVEGRGRASALLGFTQYGGGMLGSAVLGILSNGTYYPLFLILFTTSAVSLLLILRARRLAVAAAYRLLHSSESGGMMRGVANPPQPEELN